MKPLLTIITYIQVYERYVKRWGLKFLSHPNQTLTSSSQPYPLWSILLFFCFLCRPCNAQLTQGTKIVAVITDDGVAVAADSAALDGDGNIKTRSFCKIRRVADVYVALAHIVEYPPSGFDAYRTSSAALNTPIASFSDKVVAVEGGLTQAMFEALRFMYTYERPLYNKVRGDATLSLSLQQERSVLALMMFGIEGNRPVVSMREFAFRYSLLTDMPISVSVREDKSIDCPGPRCPDPPIMFMGADDRVAAFLPQLNQKWILSELKPYELARFLVTVRGGNYT